MSKRNVQKTQNPLDLMTSSEVNYDEKQFSELKPGMIFGQKYRLVMLLGEGGMGQTWLVDELVGEKKIRNVVIKILTEEIRNNKKAMEQVRYVFDMTQKLGHPNICSLLTLDQYEEYGDYLVMHYAEGGTLKVWFQRQYLHEKGLSLKTLLPILRPIAEALDFAHSQGIIHRDVKPENIMFTQITPGKPAIPVLIDFGLSARISSDTTISNSRSLKLACDTSGTPLYMAPEQHYGYQQDGRTDQYALAMVLYEMLSGELPYDMNLAELISWKVNLDPSSRKFSKSLNKALKKALSPQPDKRFASCVEFLDAAERKGWGVKNVLAGISSLGAIKPVLEILKSSEITKIMKDLNWDPVVLLIIAGLLILSVSFLCFRFLFSMIGRGFSAVQATRNKRKEQEQLKRKVNVEQEAKVEFPLWGVTVLLITVLLVGVMFVGKIGETSKEKADLDISVREEPLNVTEVACLELEKRLREVEAKAEQNARAKDEAEMKAQAEAEARMKVEEQLKIETEARQNAQKAQKQAEARVVQETKAKEEAEKKIKEIESKATQDAQVKIDKFKKQLDGKFEYEMFGNSVVITKYLHDVEAEIETIEIPNGVTDIGEEAFYGSCGLRIVVIPASVTRIGRNAFGLCERLNEIVVSPDNVHFKNVNGTLFTADGKTIIKSTNYDYPLKRYTIPDGVISIEEDAFSFHNSLESLTISPSVRSIGDGAFSLCADLKSVTISNSVTSIGKNAFGGCTNLTSVTIPPSVTSIGAGAFSDCFPSFVIIGKVGSEAERYAKENGIKFEEATPDWGIKELKKQLDDKFDYEISGSSVIITRYTGSSDITKTVYIPYGVTSLGKGLFSYDKYIKSVMIPDSVTTIEDEAFFNCDNITTMEIPSSVTHIGVGAFSSCKKLTKFIVSSKNTHFKSVEGILFSADGKILIKFPNGKDIAEYTIHDNVTNIAAAAFEFCSSLTSVTIPDGVISIGDRTFWGCKGLMSVTIPSSVTSISSSAFGGCKNLTIYGKAGSEAERFAMEEGIKFQAE